MSRIIKWFRILLVKRKGSDGVYGLRKIVMCVLKKRFVRDMEMVIRGMVINVRKVWFLFLLGVLVVGKLFESVRNMFFIKVEKDVKDL